MRTATPSIPSLVVECAESPLAPNAKIPEGFASITAGKDKEEGSRKEISVNLHNSDIMDHESLTMIKINMDKR